MAEVSELQLALSTSKFSSPSSSSEDSITQVEPKFFVEGDSSLQQVREALAFQLKGENADLVDSDLDIIEFGHILRPLRPFYGDFDEDADDDSVTVTNAFLYDQGSVVEDDCQICMITVNTSCRACCSQMICDSCMVQYIKQKIDDGLVHMICPASDCNQPVSRDEIICRLTDDDDILEKYHRFVTNANADPNRKTCPSCCVITTLESETFTKMGHQIVCEQCGFCWCFECHSPKHDGIKCKENMKGLKALVKWSKSQSNGQRNARRCPKCKLLIQRSGGCDHMQCTRCRTHFCYACGGRQLHARFLFGNHYDRLNVLGCPKNFMSGRKKHLRRFVRGSILSGKIVVAVAGSAVLLGLLPIAAVAAVFAGPAIGFVRLHQYLKLKRETRLAQRLSQYNNTLLLSYCNTLPSRDLVPRRDLTENEVDYDEVMRMLLTIPVTGFAVSSSESTPVSSPSRAHSSGSHNQSMLVADKDEITSL